MHATGAAPPIQIGLTLPSFHPDPELAISIAVAAESHGIDGVFVYDHMFRLAADGQRRPALECFALLTAVASATTTVHVGSLVARASLRPPNLLAQSFATVRAVAGDRVIAAIGAGDHESKVENESFGIAFGDLASRIEELSAAVDACVAAGVPVWVGGTHDRVLEVAARSGARAWNRWGGGPEVVRDQASKVQQRTAPGHDVAATTWGGLVVLDETNAAAHDKGRRLKSPPQALVGDPEQVANRLRDYVAAGAQWLVLAPVDASNPGNVELVADVRNRLVGT